MIEAAQFDARSRASRAMDAYASGERHAFDVLYKELTPRLTVHVQRMTRRDAIAEDIVQQALLNIHRARADFVRGSHVEPWAYAIASRLVLDWMRRARRERALPLTEDSVGSESGDPERLARLSELTRAIRGEIETVPRNLRDAFLLVRLEGESTAQAARMLGTTATAVKLRAHRAGKLLRPRLDRFRTDSASNLTRSAP